MGKCVVCGKRGLFLKVNQQGICFNCESRLEQERIRNRYELLLRLSKCIKENVSLPDDPIERLDEIYKIEEKIEECKRLREAAEKLNSDISFAEYLEKCITYNSASDKSIGFGRLKEFGITVWTGKYTRENPCDKLVEELIKQSDIYLKGWQDVIEMINRGAKFEKRLRGLPVVEISKAETDTDTGSKTKKVGDIDSLIKYSRITAKTDYNRTGNFVSIDTETTGLSAYNDGITEISAIKFADWKPIQVFHTLINPSVKIPKNIEEITGITNEMVTDAPSFYEIIPCLDMFIGSSNIVGHNLPFDLKFLYMNGYDFTGQKRKYYDTLSLIKSVLKKGDIENYKLTTLCEYYCIRDNIGAHRSSSDAMATGYLFNEIAKQKCEMAR